MLPPGDRHLNDQQRRRVAEILEALTPLSAPERLTRLDVLTDDEDVRAEVRSLLGHADDVTASVPGPGTGRTHADAGTLIGPYKLIRPIGEGGFGVVWLAQQTEPVRRSVALKIIKPGMDSKAVIARFEAERQALALMDHPNVARVFDGGTTDRGLPYFVMELVKGEPVTDYCDRHNLSIKDRLALFADICDAVHHAHQKGIIHRDLKPSNVLVAVREGKLPIPKVIDFGVAKAMAAPLTEATLFTTEGQMIGTPEYMSPEQADSAGTGAVDIDTRSDVYSLGVLLYELLAGTRPFDLRRRAFDEIRRVIREDDAPRPSTRLSSLGDEATTVAKHRRIDLSTLTKQLRGELEWIPLKALRKDRTERYRSAADLADDVRRYLKGEALEAGPESAAYRARKFVRRNRGLVTATVTVMVVLAAGVMGTSLALLEASHQTRIAKGEAAAAREAKQQAQYQARLATLHAASAELSSGNLKDASDILGTVAPGHRDWVWGYLNARLDESIWSEKFSGSVKMLKFLPSGKLLIASTSVDASKSTLSVWDVDLFKEIAAVQLPECMEFVSNADGTLLGGIDANSFKLYLFRTDPLRELATLEVEGANILQYGARLPWVASIGYIPWAIHPTADRVAATVCFLDNAYPRPNGSVYEWRPDPSGHEWTRTKLADDGGWQITYLGDDNHLIYSDNRRRHLRLHPADHEDLIAALETINKAAEGRRSSLSGDVFDHLFWSREGLVVDFKEPDSFKHRGRRVTFIVQADGTTQELINSEPENRFAAAFADRSVVGDRANRRFARFAQSDFASARSTSVYFNRITKYGHQADVNVIAATDDGRLVVTGDERGRVLFWDGRASIPFGFRTHLSRDRRTGQSASVSASLRFEALWSDGTIRIRDVQRDRITWSTDVPVKPRRIEVSPSGILLALVTQKGVTFVSPSGVEHVIEGAPGHSMRPFSRSLETVAFSRWSGRLAFVSTTSGYSVVDTTSWSTTEVPISDHLLALDLDEIRREVSWIETPQIDDGKPLRTLFTLDLDTGTQLSKAIEVDSGFGSYRTKLASLPGNEGQMLLLAGECLALLDKERNTMWSTAASSGDIAISPGTDYVAVLDGHDTQVFDLHGNRLTSLHNTAMHRIAFSSDGTRLLASDGSNVVTYDAVPYRIRYEEHQANERGEDGSGIVRQWMRDVGFPQPVAASAP